MTPLLPSWWYPAYGPVTIYDTSTGKVISAFHTNEQKLVEEVISPDAKLFAAGTWKFFQRYVTVWDTVTKKVKYRFPIEGHCSGLAFSPNSNLIACTVYEDNSAITKTNRKYLVWNMNKGKLEHSIDFTGAPGQILFSPDGLSLTICQREGKTTNLAVWNFSSAKLQSIGKYPENAGYRMINFTPDGASIVMSTNLGFRLIDSKTHEIESLRARDRKDMNYYAGGNWFADRTAFYAVSRKDDPVAIVSIYDLTAARNPNSKPLTIQAGMPLPIDEFQEKGMVTASPDGGKLAVVVNQSVVNIYNISDPKFTSDTSPFLQLHNECPPPPTEAVLKQREIDFDKNEAPIYKKLNGR